MVHGRICCASAPTSARTRARTYTFRELPIAVHTKFIEQHRPPAGSAAPADALDTGEQAFERRYGLRDDAPLVRMRLLDHTRQARLGLALIEGPHVLHSWRRCRAPGCAA